MVAGNYMGDFLVFRILRNIKPCNLKTPPSKPIPDYGAPFAGTKLSEQIIRKKNKVTYIKGKGVLFTKNDVVVYDVIYYNVAACDVVIEGTVTRAAAPQYKINHYSTVCCFCAFSFFLIYQS